MAKRRAVYAIDKDGNNLYVELKYSGLHPLVAMCDGVPLTFFGKEKKAYLKVVEAISWHEKELRESGGRSGSEPILSALRIGLKKFENGEVVETA